MLISHLLVFAHHVAVPIMPYCLSGDGLSVGGSIHSKPAIWKPDGGIVEIPIPSPQCIGAVTGLSRDGSVAVGVLSLGGREVLYVWRESRTIFHVPIAPCLPKISEDGTTVIGDLANEKGSVGGRTEAFCWSKLGGIKTLAVDGYAHSVHAMAVSQDGQEIVGSIDPSDNANFWYKSSRDFGLIFWRHEGTNVWTTQIKREAWQFCSMDAKGQLLLVRKADGDTVLYDRSDDKPRLIVTDSQRPLKSFAGSMISSAGNSIYAEVTVKSGLDENQKVACRLVVQSGESCSLIKFNDNQSVDGRDDKDITSIYGVSDDEQTVICGVFDAKRGQSYYLLRRS